MLATRTIQKIGTTRTDLFAFAIKGKVTRQDVHDMASSMNEAFDGHGEADMLIYFEDFQGSDPTAQLDLRTAKSQFRALSSVRRYVVVNAPEQAASLVEAMGKILPVDVEIYDDMQAALDDLDATRMTTA